MHILIIGAGVIGVTSAYFLAKAGHRVTVVDRQPMAANETSFANAGLVAPGHSYTWASPKAPAILFKSLFKEGQALRLKLSADPDMWRWGWKFLKNCTSEKSRVNTIRKVILCRYSQELLQQIAQREKISYDEARGGAFYVYRDQPSFQRGQENMKILTDQGLKIEVLDAGQVIEREPAFESARQNFAGALYCPSDESGDARKFTQELARRCEELGVEFLYEHTVQSIQAKNGQITAIQTDHGQISAEHYVLCAGSYSPILARPLGYRLPIYPVKGYSVTLPVGKHHRPPRLGGVDENNLVAWARFGDRFRLTATAEFKGYDLSHQPADFTHMLRAAENLFPDAADYSQPIYWAGNRPMTPEGTPIISKTRHANLWLNTGHGHMGWTMSCGSAKLLSNLIDNKPRPIDMTGLGIS